MGTDNNAAPSPMPTMVEEGKTETKSDVEKGDKSEGGKDQKDSTHLLSNEEPVVVIETEAQKSVGRDQLENMTLGKMKKYARGLANITEEEIEHVDDANDPKEALINLILLKPIFLKKAKATKTQPRSLETKEQLKQSLVMKEQDMNTKAGVGKSTSKILSQELD